MRDGGYTIALIMDTHSQAHYKECTTCTGSREQHMELPHTTYGESLQPREPKGLQLML